MGAPDVVIRLDVAGAEAFAPDYVVGRIDGAVLVEIGHWRPEDRVVIGVRVDGGTDNRAILGNAEGNNPSVDPLVKLWSTLYCANTGADSSIATKKNDCVNKPLRICGKLEIQKGAFGRPFCCEFIDELTQFILKTWRPAQTESKFPRS